MLIYLNQLIYFMFLPELNLPTTEPLVKQAATQQTTHTFSSTLTYAAKVSILTATVASPLVKL